MTQSLLVVRPAAYQSRDESSYSAHAEELDGTLIDPLTTSGWDQIVLSHSQSNVFHLAAWARVLKSSYGHKPFYVRFSRQGKLAALLPIMEVNSVLTGVRGVSLPFSDFCNPLVFDPTVNVAQLLSRVNTIASGRKWKYFEARSNAFGAVLNSTEQYYGHHLDLTPGVNRLFASFAPSVRRAIRKAEKEGLKTEISKSWQAMLDFYRLHIRTRRRHGLPPQPLSFFRNIHREIITAGYGFVILAKAPTGPVAAAVFFHSNREALYKFAASDDRVQSLRGNNLVMWKAIEHLATSGIQKLHLGRTDVADEGLRRFKRSWGTIEEKLQYCRFGRSVPSKNRRVSRRSYWLYNRTFRMLPLGVNRVIGRLVYGHLD